MRKFTHSTLWLLMLFSWPLIGLAESDSLIILPELPALETTTIPVFEQPDTQVNEPASQQQTIEQQSILPSDTIETTTNQITPITSAPCPEIDTSKQQYTYTTKGSNTVAEPKLPLVKINNVPTILCSQVNRLMEQQSLAIEGEKISAAEGILTGIYQQRQYQQVWTDSEHVQILMNHITSIDEDGLNQNDYHYLGIIGLQQKLTQDPGNQEQQAKLDLLMSNALLRLVYHLKFGKVAPQSLDPNWNYSREFTDIDPVTLFNTVVSSKDNLANYLSEQRNLGQLYSYLKKSLKTYRNIALSGGWPNIPSARKLRPGKRDKRIPLIHQRLLITGDINTPAPSKAIYDKAMVIGIKQFQKRHGLSSDGVIGPQTLQELNTSVGRRIDQIRANMERLRWISQDLKEKYVLVNVAGYQAYLVEDQNVIWRSKVQVGRFKRQTPIFKDTISYLELNPTWTVPPTILKEDVIPKLKQGVDIMAKKGLKILNRRGQTVDQSSVDWSNISARNFPYMLRQPPGPRNALGRIKLMFPNKHSVYLHDTPSKSKFKRTARAFSSGCVRIQNPFELAELLLDNSAKWNKKKFDRILNSKKTSRINLPNPTPILLVYATVNFDLNPDQSNLVTFNPDIYKRDAKIIEALKRPFSYSAPKAMNATL